MIYKYTSMKEVVGMVLRNTQIQDSSFIAHMHEWIFDAMAQMETEYSFHARVEDVNVIFHKAKLPCGLEYLDAVQYKGSRLRYKHAVRPPAQHKVYPRELNVGLQTFETSINKIEPITDRELYNTVLTQVNNCAEDYDAYYYTENGFINTSFSDGTVRLYFKAIPVDADNMPMIPDNQNFKNALYWYCRSMLIGAGWQDPVFDWKTCMTNFEQLYAPRAMAEIRMPGPDQMETRVDLFTRFIPDAGYYDSFFHSSGREQFYDTHNISR